MRSIRTALVLMLVAAFTLVSFLAALNGYRASMEAAEKLLDKQLSYANQVLMGAGGEAATGVVEFDSEVEFAFQVWSGETLLRRSSGAPLAPMGALESGFRYANFNGYRWRAMVSESDSGNVYVVAERADIRHRLAETVVLESVLPLMLWLPISAVLVWILVGWGLKPVRELSRQINLKRSDDLNPVSYPGAPVELEQLIASSNSLLQRLGASFEREKHFASHAAHELRTPLSVLKVHLHNLAAELPPKHEGLAYANAGLERMHNLVEQILDLNRTNPDIIKAKFQRLDLHSLVQKVAADNWPSFTERRQTLGVAGETIFMRGDQTMLETLLQNLLTNARKYTPEGGEILVSVTGVAGTVQLCVEDSGPGIAEEDRVRVLNRFYRVVNQHSHSPSGSGLGLAIVTHIVQLHHAKLTLSSSQFPTGLKVTVQFPPEVMV